MSKKPSYIGFDKKKYHKMLTENYIIRGETGVLSYPYAKKIIKYWKFRTPDIALASAQKIYQIFIKNLNSKLSLDKKFIRADICRKFLQMGYTRSMRYYYHKSGNKWGNRNGDWFILPYDYDPVKKYTADIFKRYLIKCMENPIYQELKSKFILKYHRN